jgi:hypothetical protein
MMLIDVRNVLVGGLILLACGASAQETVEDTSDPLDLSRFEEMVSKNALVTMSEIKVLEDNANVAYKSGDCEAALPQIKEFYEKANSLSNTIRQGVEPYYSASYDDRETYSLTPIIAELAEAEAASNDLIRKRNMAWVMEADCLIKTGEQDAGIAGLYRALEYISIQDDERDLWKKARMLLWQQIEYPTK